MTDVRTRVLLSCLLALLALSAPARAVVHDFESGDLALWRATTTGSMASDVGLHNASRMASLRHSGSNRSALSIDFPFSPIGYVAFDMQTVPVRVTGMFGRVLESGGGVTITFSTAFNVVLGKVSFFNVTNPSSLGATEFLVDGAQHNYSSTMAELASLARVSDISAIAKVNLSFAGWGDFQNGGNIYPNYASSATVWFDNVAVTEFDAEVECFLNWVERTYPAALRPSGVRSRFLTPYTYRYYGTSDAYIGVSTKDNRVYYLGADRVGWDFGALNSWLGLAACR